MKRVALESRWTRVDGLAVHYLSSPGGGGTPVVGVHGLGVSTRYLRPALALLGSDHTVSAPDFPGFGRSGRPAEALSVPEHAAFLERWLTRVGIERAIFFANSMGCQTAVELAIRAPERAVALVLVGPTVDPAARSISRQLARLAIDSLREPISLTWIVATDYAQAGPRRTYATARHMLDHRMEERLPLVNAPTLVVRGERDPIASQGWVELAAELAPRGRLAVIPGAPHAAHYAEASAVVASARTFFAEPH